MGGGSNDVKETADQVAQQQINAKLWNFYQTNYKPMVDKYAAKTSDPTVKAGEEKQVAGQIHGEVMKHVDVTKGSDNPVANVKRLSGVSSIEAGAQVGGSGYMHCHNLYKDLLIFQYKSH
jgi:hypothetical protein